MAGCELPSLSWEASEDGWTSLDCPERFPAIGVVKAREAESTSCGAWSVGRGCVWEAELATWPGMRLRVQEAEYLFLPEVAVVEPGWPERVVQEERAEEEEVLERKWKRKVEVQ